MRFTRILAVAVLAAAAACSDQTTPVAAVPDDARILAAPRDGIDGAYIVVLKEGADPRSVAAVAGVNPRYVYTRALNGFAGALNQGQLAALSKNPNVDYIEQDARVRTMATQYYPTWGLDRVDQRYLPLSSTYTYTPTGAGVRAYILDTGILTSHTEFGGRASVGADYIGDGWYGQDCNGHGTHVAGTVGGATYGVAKGVSLVAVRVLDCYGNGTWSGVIAGMDWVANYHVKPAVANMSLGGGANQAADDAVNRMHNAGVTVVVAAGNYEDNACYYSPARAANAITVGATNSGDARASSSNTGYWGSNYGACLDIFAPGVGITSAWHTSTTATNTIDGTSMATPHVAGVAALYLQGNTTASPATVASAIINNATTGVVSGAGTGSPNRLVYSIVATQPVSTVITGPASINAEGTYTWDSNPAGGDGNYIICWEYRVAGGAWQIVGSSRTYSRPVYLTDPDFELRVAVTSLGVTVADTHLVDVIGGTTYPAPTAGITGPSSITATGTYTWDANASGGDGSYAYTWEHRVQGSSTWTVVGSGSSYSRSVGSSDADFELRVTVTSAGQSGSDTHLVDVDIPTGLSVTITGPDYVWSGEYHTWYANPSGGTGSYTYQWQYRLEGSSTWSNVGTGSSYTRRVPVSPFYLRLIVTSGGATASDDHYVYVEYYQECGSNGYACP